MALGIQATPSGFWSGSNTMLTGAASSGGGAMSQLAQGMQSAAPMLAIAGAVQSAVGTYYAAKTQQYQIESQASEKRYQLKAQQFDNQSKLSTVRYQASSQKTGLGGPV